MEYIDACDARNMCGLRLALTYRIPNPFGEAAKAIFRLKGIPFIPVAQHSTMPNDDLLAWTGHRNAPVAVWNDEPARAGWAEIIMLAERLNPDPPLLPSDRAERAMTFGICNEICGEDGYGWNSRLLMFPDQAVGERRADKDTWADLLQTRYGGSKEAVATAAHKAGAVLKFLAEQLRCQKKLGSRFFVGNNLTAADIYWAALSIGVAQLPEQKSATPRFLQKVWGRLSDQLNDDLDPLLLEHRDYIFDHFMETPLDF